MSNLSRFNLSHNHLKAMPDCMHKETRKASFPHLHYFDLRSNQISTIPNVDTQLRDLEVLNISRNQIKELPVEFLVSMPSLKNLDASRNEICEHVLKIVWYMLCHVHIIILGINSLHWRRYRSRHGKT